MASLAPASLKHWAMAQAMLRLFAIPKITAFLPCMLSIGAPSSGSVKPNRISGRAPEREWRVAAPVVGSLHEVYGPLVRAFIKIIGAFKWLRGRSPIKAGA